MQLISRWALELLKLVLIVAGFLVALASYRFLYPENYQFLTSQDILIGMALSVGTFWVVFKLLEAANTTLYLDVFLSGVGLNLLLQALLNYFQLLTRSIFLIVVGGALASILLVLFRRWLKGQEPSQGVLILGADASIQDIAATTPVLGGIGLPGTFPASVPYLGGPDQWERICEEMHPSYILISKSWLSENPADRLLEFSSKGTVIKSTNDLYSDLFGRIHYQQWNPVGLLLSTTIIPDSETLAVQAIYTNIIGLALLIVLAPLLLGITLAILATDGRPVMEVEECSGFQDIPFLRLRFRTYKKGTGERSWIGGWLVRLRLNNLPLLFNVVRGEMALFGPQPIRSAFTQRMSEMLPFYPMRLAVKPGVFGWDPPQASGPVDELSRIEYDLYYIKYGSPQLDLELLSRILFRRSSRRKAKPLSEPAV